MLRVCLSIFLVSLIPGVLLGETPAQQKARVVSDLVLLDLEKFQELSFRIYHPTEEGRYPVIIFSHSRGEDQTSQEGLNRYWANHGYICIVPSHQDSEDFRRETQEELKNALILQSIHKRIDDVRFILDSVKDIGNSILPSPVKLDISRIGLAGEDWGAQVAQLLGGGTLYERNADTPISFEDPRIRAFLVVNPPHEVEPFSARDDSWQAFFRPLMVVTGPTTSQESRASIQACFQQSPRGNKSLLSFKNSPEFPQPGSKFADDLPIQALSFQEISPSALPGRDPFPLKAQSTLNFWEAFLKGKTTYKQALKNNTMDPSFSQTATLEFRD